MIWTPEEVEIVCGVVRSDFTGVGRKTLSGLRSDHNNVSFSHHQAYAGYEDRLISTD